MFSAQARKDIRDLISSGAALTSDEIIILNGLGIDIKKAGNAEDIYCPRIAWAGDMPLYELSIQANLWYDNFACKKWLGGSLSKALVWASANSRESGFFEQYWVEKKARKAIASWYKRIGATDDELNGTMDYIINGYGDGMAPEDDPDEAPALSQPRGCPYTEIVNEAISTGVGLSLQDIKSMPVSQINDILTRWTRNQIQINGAGKEDLTESVKSSAMGVYFRYLAKLRVKYGNQ